MPSRLVLVKEYVWLQMLLVAGNVILGTLYAVGLWTQNNLLLALVSSAYIILGWPAFLVLALIPSVWIIITQFAILFRRKPIAAETRDRLSRLSLETMRRMNLNRNIRFKVTRRTSSARVRQTIARTTVLVGERFILGASDEAVIGVIGHEVGHVLKHHLVIKTVSAYLIVISFLAVFFAGQGSRPSLTLSITVLFALLLATIPLNWKLEYDADKVSAERLGPDPIVTALEKLRLTNFDGISFTHPPLSKRIRRIKSFQVGITSHMWDPTYVQ